jgi:hypothetical protein
VCRFPGGGGRGCGLPRLGQPGTGDYSAVHDHGTADRSMTMALPIGYRISSGAAEHAAMHLACMGAKKGPMALLVSDSAAVGKALILEMDRRRDGKRQHAGVWEYPERIFEAGWVKSHLTVRQGVAAGFKAEWIFGNSWADKLADEAMHVLVNEQGEKVAHKDFIKDARCRGNPVVEAFKNMAKGGFASYGTLGGQGTALGFCRAFLQHVVWERVLVR